MGYTVAGKNYMLEAIGGVALYASLHSGDPGDTGANEISGGAPAYARKAITWGTASGGVKNHSNQPVFDVGSGVAVRYVGIWSAVSGGTFYASGQVTTRSFSAQGTYTLEHSDLNLNL